MDEATAAPAVTHLAVAMDKAVCTCHVMRVVAAVRLHLLHQRPSRSQGHEQSDRPAQHAGEFPGADARGGSEASEDVRVVGVEREHLTSRVSQKRPEHSCQLGPVVVCRAVDAPGEVQRVALLIPDPDRRGRALHGAVDHRRQLPSSGASASHLVGGATGRAADLQ